MTAPVDCLTLAAETADLVRQTGQALLSWQVERIEYKGNDPQDLVSNLDRKVQDRLAEGLQLLQKADFYAEEKTNAPISGLTWIVDPIDGTTNFISRGRDYAISVALYAGANPLLGIVYDVERDDLYQGISGHGASLNGRLLAQPPAQPLSACILEMSIGTLRNLMRRTDAGLLNISREVRATRSMGCASLALCQVAAGRLQLYLSSRLRPWDHAAARVILEEVGGIVAPLFPAESEADPFLDGAPLPLLGAANSDLAAEILHRYFSPVADG